MVHRQRGRSGTAADILSPRCLDEMPAQQLAGRHGPDGKAPDDMKVLTHALRCIMKRVLSESHTQFALWNPLNSSRLYELKAVERCALSHPTY